MMAIRRPTSGGCRTGTDPASVAERLELQGYGARLRIFSEGLQDVGLVEVWLVAAGDHPGKPNEIFLRLREGGHHLCAALGVEGDPAARWHAYAERGVQ